ncbi:MAG: polysaccharide biosynthesis/export family protein [Ginsengibacter sp.]
MQKLQLAYKSIFRMFGFFLLVSYLSSFLVSCVSSKKNVLYFENLPKDTILYNLVTKDFEIKIRKGDVINIAVTSLSTEASLVFNSPQVAAGGANSGSGYMVDLDGNVLYPKLGVIHVEGMSPTELRDRLLKDLLPYLKDPAITVTFVNHKIVIIGEVNQVLMMPNESMTILEAISQSGGVPLTARKDNILVIRENGADKQFKRLNLNNSSIFTSPFYYLKPNDILYVEPDLAQKGAGKTQQIVGYITAGISLIFIIADRIIK